MKNPMTFLRRCCRLRERGLSGQLWNDLRETGDESLLEDVESLSGDELIQLSPGGVLEFPYGDHSGQGEDDPETELARVEEEIERQANCDHDLIAQWGISGVGRCLNCNASVNHKEW